jgi:hypothetical protein
MEGNPIEKIADLLKDGFQLRDLQEAARIAVQAAEDAIPGASGYEKRRWCGEKILKAVEDVDHLIPVIGPMFDTPLADLIEKTGVMKAVDIALRPFIDAAHLEEAYGLKSFYAEK